MNRTEYSPFKFTDMKFFKEVAVFLGGYFFVLFSLMMLVGTLRHLGQPTSNVLMSDGWLLASHPVLAVAGLLYLVYFFTPDKYLFFWRKEKQA